MKCSCGKFEVPQCCNQYLEDILGNLVHTKLVCYEQGTGCLIRVIEPPVLTIVAWSGTLKKLHPTPDQSVFPRIDYESSGTSGFVGVDHADAASGD